MGQIVLWALSTGLISGVVWAGIVLLQRQRRLFGDLEDAVDRLEEANQAQARLRERLLEVEDRLTFTERLVSQGLPLTGQLPPGGEPK